jgi:hypothetical protein
MVVYADDVNMLGENINTTKRNVEALLDASKDMEKTKCIVTPRHRNAE